MSSIELKEDLSNCLINFDRRVLITELLDKYDLPYEEVNKIVLNYLEEQSKVSFEKRYLLHGFLEGDERKEIYRIVEEVRLEEWLKKLKNAESSLYSVEVAGGAKSSAPIFKPMKTLECAKRKQEIKSSSAKKTEHCSANIEKKEDQQVKSSCKQPSIGLQETAKGKSSVSKGSSKTESPPTDNKKIDKKVSSKKGINNFFAPSTTTSKKSDDTKASTSATKTTPKKMQDFFKKQTETPKINTESVKKPDANNSVQLFAEEEEPEDVESSDEEEKLEALKRDIISSDVEMDEENEVKQGISNKRRRILDTDDEEEDPPVKQEKLDIKEEKQEEDVAETYLDEEGFVITKKTKQKVTSTANKSVATKKTPPVTIKTSPKDTKKSSSSLSKEIKPATNPTAKTKQAGIMNFFSKK